MRGRTRATSRAPRLLALEFVGVVVFAGATGQGCAPFERASDCAALAEATHPLSKLGTLEPTNEALGRAVRVIESVTDVVTKLPKPHPSLKEPKKALQKQLEELTRELESAEKALEDDNLRAYSAARTRVLTREKSLSQSLSALTAACR